jgi:hypothetical protein
MREQFSIAAFFLRAFASAIIGGVSYLLVCAALRPRGWSLKGPVSESENLFAIGMAMVVFAIVLWRLMRGSWTKEQVGKLLDFDDTSY